MENLTLGQIVSAIAIISALGGALMIAAKPFNRLNKVEEAVAAMQKDTTVIMRTLIPMLKHMADDKTGNHTDELQAANNALMDYLTERK